MGVGESQGKEGEPRANSHTVTVLRTGREKCFWNQQAESSTDQPALKEAKPFWPAQVEKGRDGSERADRRY